MGEVVYIVTGDETGERQRMNGTRCRITEDHGNCEYSWTPAPATHAEMMRLIEEMEAAGKLPIRSSEDRALSE